MTAFIAIVPARLASTRLPRKPLADIHGLPMVVRVAQRAAASGAQRVVVAADSEEIVAACRMHGVDALLTSPDHPTGTDRVAEAAAQLGLADDAVVVNVQGDEPLMPPATVAAVAALLMREADCGIATAAHPLHEAAEFFSPNVVKVVTDRRGRALMFSRAPMPWSRDAFAADRNALPADLPAWRHIGLYAYRAGFLRAFPALARAPIEQHESLEQLRALWHGVGIAVLPLDAPLPPGVDTPADLETVRKLLSAT
ncbi:MAG: 3-deoxy-manno-octulosonate cytidylyltransferase [Burkholderiaceae bacterium]|jgi:3-deoxy-manno-octulosonate cytidylyltransferase (CMP-KDO synthetase)|nr:3-deoxy-manno-octulosonate cytidylyltransferase [Burkholderiaceae bacterium]